MMKSFLMIMLIFFSIIMFFLNHPLSFGMMILIQTIIMCLLTGMMSYSYWFSYILFLTFLGGMLILFMYVSSIASNEIFKLNKMFMFFLIIITLFSFMYLKNNFQWNNNFFNIETNNFFNMFMFFNYENNINLSKLYNEQTYLLMLMMIIYLFITLIAIVKITNISYGPLRSFN